MAAARLPREPSSGDPLPAAADKGCGLSAALCKRAGPASPMQDVLLDGGPPL